MFKKTEQPQLAEQPPSPVDPLAAILARLEAIEARLDNIELRLRYVELGRRCPDHLLPRDQRPSERSVGPDHSGFDRRIPR